MRFESTLQTVLFAEVRKSHVTEPIYYKYSTLFSSLLRATWSSRNMSTGGGETWGQTRNVGSDAIHETTQREKKSKCSREWVKGLKLACPVPQ